MKDKFDPIDRDILKALSKSRLRVTPTKIARAINIHPATAKRRIEILNKKKHVDCKFRGNRLMCKIKKKS